MRRLLALLLLAVFPGWAEEPPEADPPPPWVFKDEAAPPLPAVAPPPPSVLLVPPTATAAASEQDPIGKPTGKGFLESASAPSGPSGGTSWWKTAGACLLTGLLLGLGVVFLRRVFPSRLSGRSGNLLEVVGRTPLGPKQSVVLLRVAGRVLVVGVGPDSMSALAEIANPEEVEKILLKEPSPPSDGFRARLGGVLAPFRGAPLGTFGAGAEPASEGLEGEIRALERRVASWRMEDGRT